MMAWSRSARSRSGAGIAAIFASTAPSSLSPPARDRVAALSSWARSRIAARSSSVNPLEALPLAVVLAADFRVAFLAGFFSAMVSADATRARKDVSCCDGRVARARSVRSGPALRRSGELDLAGVARDVNDAAGFAAEVDR